jgi:hypothetical protein
MTKALAQDPFMTHDLASWRVEDSQILLLQIFDTQDVIRVWLFLVSTFTSDHWLELKSNTSRNLRLRDLEC